MEVVRVLLPSLYWGKIVTVLLGGFCLFWPIVLVRSAPCNLYSQCDGDDLLDRAIRVNPETQLGNSAGHCYGIGSTISLVCQNDDYMLSSTTDTLTCTLGETGTSWSEPLDQLLCVARSCVAPTHDNTSVVLIPNYTSYANGTKLKFDCKPGFEQKENRTVSTVCLYGNWTSYNEINCTARSCDAPTYDSTSVVLIPNYTSYANGTKLKFDCKLGFEQKENRTVSTVCLYGYWTSYNEINCTACTPGMFGEGCQHICHCSTNASCSITTGMCTPAGCASGWKGSNCQDACTPGMFGGDCQHTCHCSTNASCSITTGMCTPAGCASGWKGSNCQDARPCHPPTHDASRVVLWPNDTSYVNGTEVRFICNIKGGFNQNEYRKVVAVCQRGDWTSYEEPHCTYCNPYYQCEVDDDTLIDRTIVWHSHNKQGITEGRCYGIASTISIGCEDKNAKLLRHQPDFTRFLSNNVTFPCISDGYFAGWNFDGENNTWLRQLSCEVGYCFAPKYNNTLVVVIPNEKLYANGTAVEFGCKKWFKQTVNAVCHSGNWTSYNEPNCRDFPIWLLIVGGIFIVFLLILCVVMCWYYCSRRASKWLVTEDGLELNEPTDANRFVSKINIDMSDPKQCQYDNDDCNELNESTTDLHNINSTEATSDNTLVPVEEI